MGGKRAEGDFGEETPSGRSGRIYRLNISVARRTRAS
jgi:hypothetical protein